MFLDGRFSGCSESLRCTDGSDGSESGEELWILIDQQTPMSVIALFDISSKAGTRIRPPSVGYPLSSLQACKKGVKCTRVPVKRLESALMEWPRWNECNMNSQKRSTATVFPAKARTTFPVGTS